MKSKIFGALLSLEQRKEVTAKIAGKRLMPS